MAAPQRRDARDTPSLLAMLAVLQVLSPAAAVHVSAQQASALPDGWAVRPDRPGADPSEVLFADMPPGWHVTTGPAAILYDPGQTAQGRFRVEMEVYLFDPAGRREAFGFFTGGRDLDGTGQSYTCFLLREGGEYLVKKRRGNLTETVSDWTFHEAIRSFSEVVEGDATAKNLLVLEAGDETVRLLVNDVEVAVLTREGLDLDGVVGLRVDPALNLHVSRLEVTPQG